MSAVVAYPLHSPWGLWFICSKCIVRETRVKFCFYANRYPVILKPDAFFSSSVYSWYLYQKLHNCDYIYFCLVVYSSPLKYVSALFQSHFLFMTMNLQYNLRLGMLMLPILLVWVMIDLAVQGLLCFCENCNIDFLLL